MNYNFELIDLFSVDDELEMHSVTKPPLPNNGGKQINKNSVLALNALLCQSESLTFAE